MRSLSWLGWAALTSAAGIIYLALVLVPGPDPGPQLADLTAAGEESEAPGEPDGPKLEPVEFIDLAQVPHEPFPNSAEPPLADPPAGGVVQAVGFQPKDLPVGEPFDGPTLPVMPYCKDDVGSRPSDVEAYPIRRCDFEQPAGEELPCPCPGNKSAIDWAFPFFSGLFPIAEPISDCIHFGKAPSCCACEGCPNCPAGCDCPCQSKRSWTAKAAPFFVSPPLAPEEPQLFEGEEQEVPARKLPQSRRLPNGDDNNPTHPEVDSAEVRPSDLPKNYGRTPF
jgi:hypothetical protein